MYAIVAPDYTDPSGYVAADVEYPEIKEDNEVLIRVCAASINPGDIKKANGVFKMAIKEQFPYVIGYDAAGVIEAVGPNVRKFHVGDEVYVRLPEVSRGSLSEYVVCAMDMISEKPKKLSFSDAASVPLAGLTALQALQEYRASLKGKTVFVTAGLSATGLFACQLAKYVYRAGRVITTVSTAKVPKVDELLDEGVVDQIIDYTREDPAKIIPHGSVDFFFDTTGQAMDFLCLMTKGTGLIVSIATTPSSATLQKSDVMQRPDHPQLPLATRMLLDSADAVRQLRAWRWGVRYRYMFMEPRGDDLRALGHYLDGGQIHTVVGARVDIHDIDAVREACMQVHKGKAPIGKTVFEFEGITEGT